MSWLRIVAARESIIQFIECVRRAEGYISNAMIAGSCKPNENVRNVLAHEFANCRLFFGDSCQRQSRSALWQGWQSKEIEALNRPPAGSAATEVVAVAKDITAYRPRDLVAHLGYQVVIFMHKVNEDKQAPMVRIQGCA